jgi:phage protein D
MQRHAPGIRLVLLANEKAINGEPLDFGTRVMSLTYEDSEKKADKVTITLNNEDLSLFERSDIVNGCVLEVSWGYPGNMARPRRVVIQKLKGFQTLTLEGVATPILHAKQGKSRAWKGKTRSQVVRLVAEELGYVDATTEIQDTTHVIDVINQSAESDAAFIRRMAAKEHFVFYVDGNGFHWHERKVNGAPTHVFEWSNDKSGTLKGVSVESDLMRRVGRVDVKGRNPVTKATIGESGDSASVDRGTLGTVVEVVDPKSGRTALQTRNATSTVHSSSASTPEAAKAEAKARFKKAESEAIKLTIELVGDPTLDAKKVVELRGISTILSGKYYLTEVKHTIDGSGYGISAKATRDAMGGRSGATGKGEQTQGGTPNRSDASKGGELTPIEKVDAKSGRTAIEYRRKAGQPIGGSDPEAKR